jgi:hypothetical protein
MTTTRKQREERQMGRKRKLQGGGEGEACRYGIFTVEIKPAALAVLGVDTIKHVGRIRGIMGKWKRIEL